MAGLLLLGFLMFAGAALFVVLIAFGVVLKLMLRLVLLPLLLLKWLIGGIVLFVVGPILAIVGLLVLLITGAALSIPLLPFLVLGLLIWLLVRTARRPAVV